MMKLSRLLKNIGILYYCTLDNIRIWLLLVRKGQKREYDILQTAHRLEKGLLNENPKSLWGWDKANMLAMMLKEEDEGSFSAVTGKAVLAAYLENKQNSSEAEEKRRAEILVSKLGFNLANSSFYGGAISVRREDIELNSEEMSACEKLFNTRHSVRDFTNEKVKKEDLVAAIQLALRAPSACNRQPTRIYVYQDGEQQSLFLTSNVMAFSASEFHDWIVSTSIFAGYLSLTLHLLGIGSCIFRKPLFGTPSFMKDIKRKCTIPNNEKIILEMKVGYYKDIFNVAVSNRRNALDIISFING